MDRQDVFDVARVITELAMNAESAGARRFDLTLSQGKLTAEDDGCGMSEEQFSLAKRGLFTTKGEGRGKGLQLINRFCKLQMQREGEITRITCTFTHLELGDIAGAAVLAAAGEMTVRCEIFGRVTLLWAARGDAVKILENKKRYDRVKHMAARLPSGGNYEDNSRYKGYQGEHAACHVHP